MRVRQGYSYQMSTIVGEQTNVAIRDCWLGQDHERFSGGRALATSNP